MQQIRDKLTIEDFLLTYKGIGFNCTRRTTMGCCKTIIIIRDLRRDTPSLIGIKNPETDKCIMQVQKAQI